MSGKTGGNRGPRRAAVLAVAAAVAVLITACGVVHVHLGSSGGSVSTGSATYRAELAYAQCMRAHGLPGFPDPHPHPSGGPTARSGRRMGGVSGHPSRSSPGPGPDHWGPCHQDLIIRARSGARSGILQP